MIPSTIRMWLNWSYNLTTCLFGELFHSVDMFDDVVEFVQKPTINLGQFIQAVNGVALFESRSQHKNPLVSRVTQFLETNFTTLIKPIKMSIF